MPDMPKGRGAIGQFGLNWFFCLLDSMLEACYFHDMANLQVKNVPASLHRRLRSHARKHRRTLSDFVLEAVRRELERSEWRERLEKRSATDLEVSAASLLEQERQLRDGELE